MLRRRSLKSRGLFLFFSLFYHSMRIVYWGTFMGGGRRRCQQQQQEKMLSEYMIPEAHVTDNIFSFKGGKRERIDMRGVSQFLVLVPSQSKKGQIRMAFETVTITKLFRERGRTFAVIKMHFPLFTFSLLKHPHSLQQALLSPQ